MSNATAFLALCLFTTALVMRANGAAYVKAPKDGKTSVVGREGEYDEENCIEVTLPNIFDIEQCLGGNLHLCKGETTLLEGVLSLANCTVSSMLKNLSLTKALVTVKDLLIALFGKLIPQLGDLSSIDMSFIPWSDKIKDNLCHGEIKISLPNSLGKCVKDTLKLCKDGSTIDISLVESLVDALTCLVKDLLTNAPQDTVSGLLCEVARALSAVLGQMAGGGILSRTLSQVCASE